MATPEDEGRVVRLHDSGVPSSHIARRTGLPRREVNAILRRRLRSGKQASR